MHKKLNNLPDTKKFAEEFLQMVIDGDRERNVILLQGNLGAGKTTFSQFFLEKIGAEGPFTSPTFVIMKKYELNNSSSGPTSAAVQPLEEICKDVYHLDCYRVDEASVLDLGWEEMIEDKTNVLLVEWPEKIKNIWPEKYWLLKFEYGEDKDDRRIEIIKK
jgi:tRNA threonylcarbamoyladenosine biosynthesis protein TsaE